MNASLFYGPIRLILGDRKVQGLWNYDDDTLKSAITTTFFVNLAPPGYALDPASMIITPDPGGDAAALLTFQSALLCIGGEEGANSFRTKAISVHEFGDRKRDLLADLRQKIYEIRDGNAQFSTLQGFVAFLANMPAGGSDNILGPIAEFSQITLSSGIVKLNI